MSWKLSPRIGLRNERISHEDADRQTRTAAEILRRLDSQPGVILADEVGMGKTYVALAVAVSVLESTKRKQPVIVMVPPAVADKWPIEWAIFEKLCLSPGHGIRASTPIRRGSDLLKLLDDDATKRKHLIFLTHGALTSSLTDPFVRLALIRQASLRRSDLKKKLKSVARFAGSLLADRRFADQALVEALFAVPPAKWQQVWNRWRPDKPLDDDPVPFPLLGALANVDLAPLRDALALVPSNQSQNFDARIKEARRHLNATLNTTWTASLGALDVRLPLLILDEAHHLKNPNRLSHLFDNTEAEQDIEALQGPLGNMFQRMLFLTATPFQLGHHELLSVLRRFSGVRWQSKADRSEFKEQRESLSGALDRAQATALRLERAWSRIDPNDASVVADLTTFTPQQAQPEQLRTALTIAAQASSELKTAEALLRPWVIRHPKPNKSQGRHYLTGRAILDDKPSILGLPVEGAAILPFLLAARAQAIASQLGADGLRSARPYFAYGLASSFEAYADTRNNRAAAIGDTPDELPPALNTSTQLTWYLDKIHESLPTDATEGWAAHPKIAATTSRVLDLWRNGEKTLVFCFYIETGRALRSHISRALRGEIVARARKALKLHGADDDQVLTELEKVADRLLRSDARGYIEFRQRIRALSRGLDDSTAEQMADIAVRFMRTPSFLVRLTNLSPTTTAEDLLAGLDRKDSSGATLTDRFGVFAETLARGVEIERAELLVALAKVQTGGIATTADYFDQSERSKQREVLLPDVRLTNGGVSRETRRRLMLTFNTPFFPEVLIASSVMAEGVDLHQDCRHVIHHDLAWNPSTLEQRTGRLDRIGSKAIRTKEPVVVYEPFLGGTHDEKIFRVVKDRERWFGVVMGETPDSGEWATERDASRIPLPEGLAQILTLNLALVSDPQ